MKKIYPNYFIKGIYYLRKQPLKFECQEELISQEDIQNLFIGRSRLIKKSSEYKIESKYLKRIKYLEKLLDGNNIAYKSFDCIF